jgi:hypothetical protein
MIGLRPSLVSIKLEIRFVNSMGVIDPSECLHHLERNDRVILAMEQPDPAIRKIRRIVDQPPGSQPL